MRGERPTGLAHTGSAVPLLPPWIALCADVSRVPEGVMIADIASGALPGPVREPAAEPAARENP
jgi:hypothetical protein